MSNAANAALYEPWKDLWNGDLSLSDKIIAEDFDGHLAPLSGTGPDQFHGRQPLNDWISGIHALMPDLSFVLDVGPIADEQHLVVRWKARGTYRGGFPGASPAGWKRPGNYQNLSATGDGPSSAYAPEPLVPYIERGRP